MEISSNSFSGDINKKVIQCPKCNGGMVQGWISDLIGDDRRRVSIWVEGAPTKPGWFKRVFGTGVPVSGEKSIPVGTFRCSVCGFLESYANTEFAAK